MTCPFPVLYEDDTLLAIDKPPLYHCIEHENSSERCIATELAQWCPSLQEVSSVAQESGLVHRLDFSTSGVLLVAKSKNTWSSLRDQFSFGGIQKEYLAMCEGLFEDEIRLDNFIGSPYRRGKKVRVYPAEQSRSQRAISTFSLHKLFKQENCSLLHVSLETGVRHQIRAHAAFLKHSLVGDELYGSETSREKAQELFRHLLGEQRERGFYLHAYKLTISHPTNRSPLVIESPLIFS